MSSAPAIAAFLLWPVVVLLIFRFWTPRRALIASVIGGSLFLPVARVELAGMPDLTKASVISGSALLAVVLFDRKRLQTLRPHLFDCPMAIWCLTPFASSLSNGLGVYDGISAVVSQVAIWGAPYLLGRISCGTLEGLRDLAIGLVTGAIIYLPLCAVEILVGPQLHTWVYGYQQPVVEGTVRLGGWRPMVFMQHGLMIGLWMAAGAVTAFWLAKTSTLERHLGFLMTHWAVALIVATLAVKSLNGWGLMIGGLLILFSVGQWRRPVFLVPVLLFAPLYVTARATGAWSGEGVAQVISVVVGERPGRSLAVRLDNEVLLSERARDRPIWGWARWGRQFVHTETRWGGADSLWVLTFGQMGLVGLCSMMSAMLLPGAAFLYRFPAALWARPEVAPAAALAVVTTLYLVDNLLNDMRNPVYLVAMGGLLTLTTSRRQSSIRSDQ